MNAKHLATNCAAPILFYLALVLYFVSGMSIIASLGKDPSYLILGLVTFLFGYNSWYFGQKFKDLKK